MEIVYLTPEDSGPSSMEEELRESEDKLAAWGARNYRDKSGQRSSRSSSFRRVTVSRDYDSTVFGIPEFEPEAGHRSKSYPCLLPSELGPPFASTFSFASWPEERGYPKRYLPVYVLFL